MAKYDLEQAAKILKKMADDLSKISPSIEIGSGHAGDITYRPAMIQATIKNAKEAFDKFLKEYDYKSDDQEIQKKQESFIQKIKLAFEECSKAYADKSRLSKNLTNPGAVLMPLTKELNGYSNLLSDIQENELKQEAKEQKQTEQQPVAKPIIQSYKDNVTSPKNTTTTQISEHKSKQENKQEQLKKLEADIQAVNEIRVALISLIKKDDMAAELKKIQDKLRPYINANKEAKNEETTKLFKSITDEMTALNNIIKNAKPDKIKQTPGVSKPAATAVDKYLEVLENQRDKIKQEMDADAKRGARP